MAALEVDTAVGGYSGDVEFVVADAFAGGLVGEALGRFKDEDCGGLLGKALGDGAGDWAANLFFAIEEKGDGAV